MAQTVAVIRGALNAVSGSTTDFTKSGFGTPTAAIIICAHSPTNGTRTNGLAYSVGFWDGTNQRAVGINCPNSSNTMNTDRYSSASRGVVLPSIEGSGNLAEYTVSAVTDGIRLTMSVDNTTVQSQCTVLLLAGVSAKVETLTMNPTQNSTVASASLGFAPAMVFAATIGHTAVDAQVASAVLSFGFAKSDGTHRMIAFGSLDNVGNELDNILYSETRCAGEVLNDATAWTAEVTTFGADTFTVTTRDGGSSSDLLFTLALGGANFSVDCGTLTSLTATGDDVNATDVDPDAVLLMLSTAPGTSLETDDDADGFMVGLADANGQFSHSAACDDGSNFSDTGTTPSATLAVNLDSAGAASFDLCDATIALNSSDFTLTYTTVDATARKGWWVAFGTLATKIVSVNQATETDLAQAIGRLKIKALGQASETDVAQAITRVIAAVVGQISETDAAQAIAWAPKHRALNQASEADAAQAITARKTLAIGQPAETDSAQSITARKTRALGQAVESDTAQAVSALKRAALGQASETDLAQAITRIKTRAVAQAAETDLAQPVTFVGGAQVIPVNQATETDSAQAIAWAPKHRAVNLALEIDLSQAITARKTRALGQAIETDAAQAITARRAHSLGQAVESDTAQAISALKRAALGQASETDLAHTITRSILRLLGQAAETDIALAIAVGGAALLVIDPRYVAEDEARSFLAIDRPRSFRAGDPGRTFRGVPE